MTVIFRGLAGAVMALALVLVPTVFTIGSAQAQTYTERALFFAGLPDGRYSLRRLVRDAQGNLYGTTYLGGYPCGGYDNNGCGTARVTLPTTTPTGTVTFMDGSTELGTGTLAKGKASVSTSILSAGSHNITATYAGTANISGSTSSVLVQTVN